MTPEEKAEIKAQIDEARRILREDHIIVSNRQIMEKLDKHFPEEEPDPDPDPANGPVPPKRKVTPNEPPKPKKSAWWGDALDD